MIILFYFTGCQADLIPIGTISLCSRRRDDQLELTPLSYSLSLHDDSKLWADKILQVTGKNRENFELKLIAEGYDIRTEIGEMTKFYLSK